MALTKFDKDMNIIQALDNEPNDIGGLTADALKAAFDESGLSIQEYINGTLTAEIDETFATKEDVQGIVLGQVPDGTITEEKLAPSLVLPIEQGGTGADTAESARDNLGVINTLTGTTPPTTSTMSAVGQLYLNTVTKVLYQCVEISDDFYVWKVLDPYTIGAIKTTVEVNTDPNWVLCNGEVISISEYPYFSDVASKAIKPWEIITNRNHQAYIFCDMFFYSGYYYFLIQAPPSGTYNIHWVRTADFVTWSGLTLIDNGETQSISNARMANDGANFYSICSKNSQSYLKYSQNTGQTWTWVSTNIVGINGYYGIKTVNGYLVFICKHNTGNQPWGAYVHLLGAGATSWSGIIPHSNLEYMSDFNYLNGKYVAIGRISGTGLVLLYSDAITGTYSLTVVASGVTDYGRIIFDEDSNSYIIYTYTKIYVSTNLSGPYTSYDRFEGVVSGTYQGEVAIIRDSEIMGIGGWDSINKKMNCVYSQNKLSPEKQYPMDFMDNGMYSFSKEFVKPIPINGYYYVFGSYYEEYLSSGQYQTRYFPSILRLSADDIFMGAQIPKVQPHASYAYVKVK